MKAIEKEAENFRAISDEDEKIVSGGTGKDRSSGGIVDYTCRKCGKACQGYWPNHNIPGFYPAKPVWSNDHLCVECRKTQYEGIKKKLQILQICRNLI